MIGSPAEPVAQMQSTVCIICAQPVPLEVCKTNEYGQAVHESCYVQQFFQDLRWTLGALHVTKLSYRIVPG
jgi:hypothetical protein